MVLFGSRGAEGRMAQSVQMTKHPIQRSGCLIMVSMPEPGPRKKRKPPAVACKNTEKINKNGKDQ